MSSPLRIRPESTPLEAAESAVLAFERAWEGSTGAKVGAIRSQLGLSSTRYYQLLHRALENPSSLAEDPMLVRRLQRLRAARTASRAARSFRAD